MGKSDFLNAVSYTRPSLVPPEDAKDLAAGAPQIPAKVTEARREGKRVVYVTTTYTESGRYWLMPDGSHIYIAASMQNPIAGVSKEGLPIVTNDWKVNVCLSGKRGCPSLFFTDDSGSAACMCACGQGAASIFVEVADITRREIGPERCSGKPDFLPVNTPDE